MTELTKSATPISNRILAALPPGEYQSFFFELEEIPLNYGEYIYKRGEIISDVYFPNSGIISLLASIEERATLEVGLVEK